jgi:ribosomal-protein-alanine N-acetyltransferase
MSSAPPSARFPSLNDLPLVIETPRLVLRPPTERDLEDLWQHASQPELSKYLSWSAHRDREETRAWLAAVLEGRAQGAEMVWVIEHAGRVSGCIGLGPIQRQFRACRVDRAELGYWLAIPLWGQGLTTEAATAVTRWGFETLGLHKITIGCFEDNTASKRVIDKLGYRFLCRAEDDAWRDGHWFAHLRFEMLASEWGDSTRTQRFSRPLPT